MQGAKLLGRPVSCLQGSCAGPVEKFLLQLQVSRAPSSSAFSPSGRRVQNVHTGLDLSVPQHQEVRGKMMSGHVEYQILVVTRLAAFKSAKHRPEDVVQFLVS